MSRLFRNSCTLRFEEHEFVEFFGVIGPLDEDSVSYSYELTHDVLRLLVTIFPLDGGVYTSIYRDGISEPIITIRLEGCTHSRFVLHRSRQCLEIGRPEHPTLEPNAPLSWGVRLFIEPHFHIEFIHELISSRNGE
jgi:hypothetical protein